MKKLKIILLISLSLIFTSCVGFWDCYNKLVLIQENSNILLASDSSAFFSNDNFKLILNECWTNCSPDTEHIGLSYIYINLNIITSDTILLKKEYFVLTDSIGNNFTASKLVFDEDNYDSLILLPNNNYNIFIINLSDYKNKEYFYAPFNMNFSYKLFGDDVMKYFFRDCKFDVKYFYEIAKE